MDNELQSQITRTLNVYIQKNINLIKFIGCSTIKNNDEVVSCTINNPDIEEIIENGIVPGTTTQHYEISSYFTIEIKDAAGNITTRSSVTRTLTLSIEAKVANAEQNDSKSSSRPCDKYKVEIVGIVNNTIQLPQQCL